MSIANLYTLNQIAIFSSSSSSSYSSFLSSSFSVLFLLCFLVLSPSLPRFGGGFTSWGQAFRLRHLITGKFLGFKLEGSDGDRDFYGSSSATTGRGSKGKLTNQLVLLSPSKASKDVSAFCFVNSTVSHVVTWNLYIVLGGDCACVIITQ